MNIKYTLLILSAILTALLTSGIVVTNDASALSKNQKKACFNKWVGSYYKGEDNPFPPPEGTFKKTITKQQLKNFKKSDCNKDKGGVCWLGIPAAGMKNYSGQQIHCTASDGKDYIDGKYDRGGTEVPGGTKKEDGGGGSGGSGCEGSVNVLKGFCKSGALGLLGLVIDILSVGIGIVAVGGIGYGAFLYTTAGGSQEQVKKGVNIIQNVVIGLIAYVALYAFLNFLLPGDINL